MSFEPIPSDIFLSKDVKRILNNKYVIFIGDSGKHLTDHQLKYKGELTFENDCLIEVGKFGTMSNETTYTEVIIILYCHCIYKL